MKHLIVMYKTYPFDHIKNTSYHISLGIYHTKGISGAEISTVYIGSSVTSLALGIT